MASTHQTCCCNSCRATIVEADVTFQYSPDGEEWLDTVIGETVTTQVPESIEDRTQIELREDGVVSASYTYSVDTVKNVIKKWCATIVDKVVWSGYYAYVLHHFIVKWECHDGMNTSGTIEISVGGPTAQQCIQYPYLDDEDGNVCECDIDIRMIAVFHRSDYCYPWQITNPTQRVVAIQMRNILGQDEEVYANCPSESTIIDDNIRRTSYQLIREYGVNDIVIPGCGGRVQDKIMNTAFGDDRLEIQDTEGHDLWVEKLYINYETGSGINYFTGHPEFNFEYIYCHVLLDATIRLAYPYAPVIPGYYYYVLKCIYIRDGINNHANFVLIDDSDVPPGEWDQVTAYPCFTDASHEETRWADFQPRALT